MRKRGRKPLHHGRQPQKLVVRDPVGPALRFGQMAQHDDRRLCQPQLGRGQDATMARNQLAVGGDEAGHCPAKLGHTGGDLCHLVGVMGLGIAGIGAKTGQRPVFDPAGQEGRVHAASRLALRATKVSPVSARTAS